MLKRFSAFALCLLLLTQAPPVQAQNKLKNISEVVKGAKEYAGLFKLYQKDDDLFAEVRNIQLNRPFLCPITIARGIGMGGHILNFDEQWVLMFKRVGNRIQVIRRNVHFKAKRGTPIATAVKNTYTDSILLAIPIRAEKPGLSVLINLNDIFMKDFAQLGLGSFDRARSSWGKIKAFPRNVELRLTATYTSRGSSSSVIDARGVTLEIHYGLCELPPSGYQPRHADDRVGYFLTAMKDFSKASEDSAFVRYINRWRVEPAYPMDPKNPKRLVPPKKRIVFWIEKTVPNEYRVYVREGILAWNKAFEKIGFRNVIEVRQQESEDFDPEDINYNTFRWIANDQGYAMGPSRANPFTGEIFDADIVFDASMIRFWKQEYELTNASKPASTIQAARKGWGPSFAFPDREVHSESGLSTTPKRQKDVDKRLLAIRYGACQCSSHRKMEMGMMAMALAKRGLLKPGEKVPEELIGQAIRETVMHEVGHTLGLRHNFKASTMLKNKDLHNTAITRKQGLTGSVMDYNPVNLAPKGVKQGDYFSTVLGPYDYWAIEYGYKPLSGGTDAEVKALGEIAKRAPTPGLDFGTDEDLFSSPDPLINQWDLGNDPMKYAQDRMAVAQELLKDLADRVVAKGDGYQRLRMAFGMLLNEFGNAAFLSVYHLGGVYVHRDHRDDPNCRDPLVPVTAQKQREALKFVQEHILTDRHFQFSPKLLRRLASSRWSHWGTQRSLLQSVDYPVHGRILSTQQVVLNHVFSPAVLRRVQNNALKLDKGSKPVTIAEVLRGVSDVLWMKADPKKSTVIMRNLQREHVKHLTNWTLGSRTGPADAKSLARFHLRGIGRHVKKILSQKDLQMDETTRAHLEEVQERIDKVLSAPLQAR